ncbi:MAG: hypothetical protein H5U40_13540, partial [Polyangiaceae bacterium]|nr:hypothetical protein [Polyangiaceae bacterium]
EAALVHSVDMADHQMLAHVSPRTGDPAARVRDSGVHATRIAQNIALRRSTGDALVSILESEPHRLQVLTAELTHIGLASVRGPRGMYVTQVVAELEGPLPLPPPALHDLRGVAPGRAEDVTPERSSEPVVEAETAPSPAADAPQGAIEVPVDPREHARVEARSTRPPAMRMENETYGSSERETAHAEPGFAAAEGGAGAPTLRLPNGARAGVAGYWVFYGSRWWFFPSIDGGPDTVLHADPSVAGPPSGYDSAGRPTGGPVAAPAHHASPRRPSFRWSPRRHYHRWQGY